MTKFFVFALGVIATVNAHAQTIHSPNHKLALTFALSAAGEPTYQLSYGNKPVLKPSRLGVLVKGQPGFAQGLTVVRRDSSQHDDTWTPVWGETKTIRNHYQELAVTLQQAAPAGHRVVLRFRVFDDGLGFRYEWPQQPGFTYFVVSGERTEFNLPADHKAFWIPGDYDSNEY
ncbi:MAG: glycoside hydrolase family 97 N-terminal domain-containing protein, partial [Janthinobacterium lividum]